MINPETKDNIRNLTVKIFISVKSFENINKQKRILVAGHVTVRATSKFSLNISKSFSLFLSLIEKRQAVLFPKEKNWEN